MTNNPDLLSSDDLDALEDLEDGEYIEVIDGDELIRVKVGPESARLWANRAFDAQLQSKAWAAELGKCKAVLDKLQAVAKGSYDTNFGTVVVSRRSPTTKVSVDLESLLKEELDPAEEHQLVLAAKGFDWQAIDPGLKAGGKIANWKPTTRLGEYALAAAKEEQDRKGFLVIELGKKYL